MAEAVAGKRRHVEGVAASHGGNARGLGLAARGHGLFSHATARSFSSLRGQNVHDVNFVGPVIGVAAVLVLIISGVMVIANRRRAKFVQMPLIVIIFLVSADLSLFHLWWGHRGADLWISICTAGASFLTLGLALMLRASRESASPPKNGSVSQRYLA